MTSLLTTLLCALALAQDEIPADQAWEDAEEIPAEDAWEIPEEIPAEDAWEAPPPVISAELQTIYDSRHLKLVDVLGRDVQWIIQDGMGNPVDSFSFAELTQDREAQDLLDQELYRGRMVGWSMLGTGATLLSLAAVPVFRVDHDLQRPVRQQYEDRVDREDFATDDAYNVAVEEQLALYQQDLGDFRSADGLNTDRRTTALALASAGVLTMALSPWAAEGVVRDREAPYNTWSRERAEQLVLAYNTQLKRDLGMLPPEPGARPDDDEDWDMLDEPLPDEEARMQLQPQVGPAYLGLRLTF